MQVYGFECKSCKSFFKGDGLICPTCGSKINLESIPNLYSFFDLEKAASLEELKIRFRQKVKKLHPDLNRSVDRELFIDLMAAYEVLSNKKERARYDSLLSLVDRGSANIQNSFTALFCKHKKTMQEKSTDELQELVSVFLKYDIYLKRFSNYFKIFLRGKDWDDKSSERQAKLVAIAFALVGIWFFVVGAIPVYYLTYYLLRRNSSRLDLFLSLLNIIQLLMILVYFIIVDSLPTVLHIVFWVDQLVIGVLFYCLKRKIG